MNLKRLVRHRPILWVGVASALLALVAMQFSPLYAYDDGGIGTVLFIASQVLFLPFHLALGALSPLGDEAMRVQEYLALLLGLIPYAVADWGLRRVVLGREEQTVEAN